VAEASAAAVVRKIMTDLACMLTRMYIRVSRDLGRGQESWNESIAREFVGQPRCFHEMPGTRV
jgi:hypothetical protein